MGTGFSSPPQPGVVARYSTYRRNVLGSLLPTVPGATHKWKQIRAMPDYFGQLDPRIAWYDAPSIDRKDALKRKEYYSEKAVQPVPQFAQLAMAFEALLPEADKLLASNAGTTPFQGYSTFTAELNALNTHWIPKANAMLEPHGLHVIVTRFHRLAGAHTQNFIAFAVAYTTIGTTNPDREMDSTRLGQQNRNSTLQSQEEARVDEDGTALTKKQFYDKHGKKIGGRLWKQAPRASSCNMMASASALSSEKAGEQPLYPAGQPPPAYSAPTGEACSVPVEESTTASSDAVEAAAEGEK